MILACLYARTMAFDINAKAFHSISEDEFLICLRIFLKKRSLFSRYTYIIFLNLQSMYKFE